MPKLTTREQKYTYRWVCQALFQANAGLFQRRSPPAPGHASNTLSVQPQLARIRCSFVIVAHSPLLNPVFHLAFERGTRAFVVSELLRCWRRLCIVLPGLSVSFPGESGRWHTLSVTVRYALNAAERYWLV